jgi:hypothetical protein
LQFFILQNKFKTVATYLSITEKMTMSSSRKQEIFQAIPLADASSSYDAKYEPLIVRRQKAADTARLDDFLFARFKMSALLMGVLVGFFIQFSTLGANFLVINIWGEDILNKSRNDIVVFSLVWSFFTSAMAIIILAFLRNIVSIAYLSVMKKSQEMVEELVLHLECRFVVGALIGVCTAWTITDALMGMQAQIVYSMATLAIALIWCRIMMACVGNSRLSLDDDDEEVEEPEILIV